MFSKYKVTLSGLLLGPIYALSRFWEFSEVFLSPTFTLGFDPCSTRLPAVAFYRRFGKRFAYFDKVDRLIGFQQLDLKCFWKKSFKVINGQNLQISLI